ncbi:MAG: hypothetical protein AAF801_12990 [Pseudomonadota bacterium]
MAQLLSLESFDNPATEDQAQNATYQDGYDAGYAAGQSAARDEAAALSEECVQGINTLDFTYAEARKQVLDELAPLLRQIAQKVLPHCVATGFADQIASLLIDATENSIADAVVLHVHPSQKAAVTQAVQRTSANVDVQTDPKLSEHAAWVKHAGTEAHLDMDALLAAISDTLSALDHIDNRTNTHG